MTITCMESGRNDYIIFSVNKHSHADFAIRYTVKGRAPLRSAYEVTRGNTGGTENASTGKRMYGKCKYNANLQSDKKKFGRPTSQVSVVHFQVGWASGLQIVFF